MKRLTAVLYIGILVFCGAALNTGRASASTIPNKYLDSLGHVQTYLENNQPGYISYIKDSSSTILYHSNATGNWTTLHDSTKVQDKSRSSRSDEDKQCVAIDRTTYLFITTYRSNTGRGCGAHADHNYQLTYKGGRVLVNPPDDLPVAIWITDIDSAQNDWQRIYFLDGNDKASSAIKHVYTPESGAKFTYSGGEFSTKGNGTCSSKSNPKCNAVILLLGNEYYVKVSMRSEDGLMQINNNVTRYYHTVTFDPRGGSMTDNGDRISFWVHPVGASSYREYARYDNPNSFPTPTKPGYAFKGWYSISDDMPYDHLTSIRDDMDLYAQWTPIAGAYELVPHVNASDDAVKQGDTVTFTPSITKDSANDTNNTSWKFCRLLVAPGASAPVAGSVCGNPASTLVESASGRKFNGTGPFAVGDPVNYVYTVPAGALYGSQICYALFVDSSTEESGHPAESVKCVIVAKSPRIQVWGNDTRVGSSSGASDDNNMSIISASDGSWGEYSVLAPGAITRFGSGSVATGTLLTFANKPALGGFTQATGLASLGTIPDVNAYLKKAGNAEYRAKTGINLIAAPDTISGYVANAVYTSDGTITINGDIINPSKGDNLSQMVVIAKDIRIAPSVKQVDAWLIANDTINTCWVDGDVPKIGNCGDNTNASTLRINGPIMAGSLLLNRTGGSDTDDNSAAEIINLRGDAYIWMRKLSTETGSIRTVYTRELAPRY